MPAVLFQGLEIIESTNLKYFNHEMTAEFYALKGMFLTQIGRLVTYLVSADRQVFMSIETFLSPCAFIYNLIFTFALASAGLH